MASRKGDWVKFSIEVDKGHYTKRYRVVKKTRTEMAPCGHTIMGEFTNRKLAFRVKKLLTKAWNDPDEIAWRKRRRQMLEEPNA